MSKNQHPRNSANDQQGRPSNDGLSSRAQHTWPQHRSSTAQRAAKAARVHTLTDPLGAKGFRATGQRIRSETSARRKVLLGSVATFAASFGVIVATNHTPANADPAATTNQPAATTNQPAATTSNSQATSSNGSSVGSALELFSGQTANGLTSSASSVKTTQESAASEGSASSQTTQPNSNSSSRAISSTANQTTSNQTDQSSVFLQQPSYQQPSHTRSGGS